MGGFARADGFFAGAVDEFDFNLGHFGKTQDGIGLPGVALDARAVEFHRLLEHPAHCLDGAALDLVAHPVGVDDKAHVDGDPQLVDAHVAPGVDLGEHRAVGAAVLVFVEAHAHAAAFDLFDFVTLGPAGHFCRRFEHRAAARVFEVAQAVFEWINAQLQGDLVEEGFDGKDVAMAAQRAQRRGAYGHAEHAVVDRLPAVEVVKRDGVALGAAAGGERGVDGDQALEGLFKM